MNTSRANHAVPEVSVVIPTTLRSDEQLDRAVRSALTQTVPVREVVVVVDLEGRALPSFCSPLVRVVRNVGPAHGAAAARNVGTRHATGAWIAWLDDDDYWREDKLERQLAVVAAHGGAEAVVTSRAELVSAHSRHTAPEVLPGEEPLADYLFGTPGLRRSVTRAVYAPTLLVPRSLLEREPLDERYRNWEDYEWLLRVADAGVPLLWSPEALATCDQRRTVGPSLSQQASADALLRWSHDVLAGRSARAFHNFNLTYVVPALAWESRRREALELLASAARPGNSTAPLLTKAFVGAVVPRSTWHRLRHVRSALSSTRQPQVHAAGAPATPRPAERVDICGVRVDRHDAQGTLREFARMMEDPVPHHHAGVNAAKIVDCGKDERFARIIAEADIVNPDGISVVWASRLLRDPLAERVTGVDIMDGMLELARANGWSVFLLGAKPEVVERTAGETLRKFPGLALAGHRSGYWDRTPEAERDVVAEIRASGADILFLGIPSPAKEFFYDDHRDELGVRMVVGVGGTFDVIAGEVRRAPVVAQRLGLEWAFRLVQEPRRLWRRYLFGNAEFMKQLLAQLLPGPRLRHERG